MSRPSKRLGLTSLATGLVACALFPAVAAPAYLKGYTEPSFTGSDEAEVDWAFSKSAEANSNIARINVNWRQITLGSPTVPTNPADPAYSFGETDRAVNEAVASGHRVLLTLFSAPDWAEGPNRPQSNDYPNGTWKPDPAAFGEFAQAVATRYSGSFPGAGGTALPRVGYLAAWNEGNLSDYLTPQSTGKKLVGAIHFRRMVNAFSAGVANSANPSAEVVTGGTAPYGDPPGMRRTRPLIFLREFLCLNDELKAQKRCPGGEAKFDILAHHPITLSGGPDRSAISPDDAAMPDFKHVVRTLRAAEKENTVTGGGHPAWATEFWWETKPPDRRFGIPLQKHARWVQESLYSLRKQGADAALWLQLVDFEVADDGFSHSQTGHLFVDRTPKPAFQAFRFPFVADRTSKKKVNFWTIAPADGTVEIQAKRGGDFKTVDRMAVRDGVPKQTKDKLRGKPPVRGVLGGETSIVSKPG